MMRIGSGALVALLVACSGEDNGTDGRTDTVDLTPDPVAGAVWYGEIEPIVREHCVSCHQDGAMAPFVLDDYATAVAWSGAIADATTSRRMPPWLVTDDGSCGTFDDTAWVPDEDVAAIAAWVAEGALEGDPSDGVSDPLPPLPGLDRVDATVRTPLFAPVIQGGALAENDEYRCFLIDDPTQADRFLTGFQVVPGNDTIVHHVLAMPVDPTAAGWDGRTNAVNIAEMNGADGREGWECFGTAGGNIREDSIPVVWAPGMGAVAYPEGVGVRVRDTDVMVIQVHYNLVDDASQGQTDTTAIELRFEDTVPREAVFLFPDNLLGSLFYGDPDTLPAGEEAYDYTFRVSGAEVGLTEPFEIVGLMPHMHGYGAAQSVKLVHDTDGLEQCLADVPRWDFAWQKFYFYEEAVLADPSDAIEITCTYDTRSAPGPVMPGWGSGNEMCLTVLMIVP